MAVVNNRRKKNVNFITLRKKFDSFSEAITEMSKCSPILADIFGYKEGEGNDLTLQTVYENLAVSLANHIPNITKKENIHWEFQIAANRVNVKTGDYLSFGWAIKTVRSAEDDKTVLKNQYSFRVSTFENNNVDMVTDLTMGYGWEKDKEDADEETN